ncbi:pre-rRNA-processing protein pno1 [Quaeritorhiza haematococci]|nr:pre-rRNA-processing protein pno1 [Quaeritorhiza haematococci]
MAPTTVPTPSSSTTSKKSKSKTKTKTSRTHQLADSIPVTTKSSSISQEQDVAMDENLDDLITPDQLANRQSLLESLSSSSTSTTAQASSAMETDAVSVPKFRPLRPDEMGSGKRELRRVPVPPHRMTPLKKDWMKIYQPLVEYMKLEVRMNVRGRAVELRTCDLTEDTGSVQKGADFVKAYMLGFEVDDAVALLRMDDLFIESFEVKDVKTLAGDNLSRAIGRIVGQSGKTKFAIENVSRTRIVVADTKIHILGSFQNIKVARDAVCSLILGASPGKVYSKLRLISSRLKERF